MGYADAVITNEFIQKTFDRVRLLGVSKDVLADALEDLYDKDEDLSELINERDDAVKKIKEKKEAMLSNEELAKIKEQLDETKKEMKEEVKSLSQALELAIANKMEVNVVDENGRKLNVEIKAGLKPGKGKGKKDE